MSDPDSLGDALMAAHTDGDTTKLAHLYAQAGERALALQDIEAGCFYMTHAYVFALSAGLPEAGAYNQILVAHGRDEAQADLSVM